MRGEAVRPATVLRRKRPGAIVATSRAQWANRARQCLQNSVGRNAMRLGLADACVRGRDRAVAAWSKGSVRADSGASTVAVAVDRGVAGFRGSPRRRAFGRTEPVFAARCAGRLIRAPMIDVQRYVPGAMARGVPVAGAERRTGRCQRVAWCAVRRLIRGDPASNAIRSGIVARIAALAVAGRRSMRVGLCRFLADRSLPTCLLARGSRPRARSCSCHRRRGWR